MNRLGSDVLPCSATPKDVYPAAGLAWNPSLCLPRSIATLHTHVATLESEHDKMNLEMAKGELADFGATCKSQHHLSCCSQHAPVMDCSETMNVATIREVVGIG